MVFEQVLEKFKVIGAHAAIEVRVPKVVGRRRNDPPLDYTIDVREDRKEQFEVFVSPTVAEEIEITVPSVDKAGRHLLLSIRKGGDLAQYLCGHDERHWFVAALPKNVASVHQAMEALKPQPAAVSQTQQKVRKKNLNKRRNAGFVRQGEWFFIPAPEMDARTDLLVHENEPMRRGQGKPHMAQFLCRLGGETVYVSRAHQEGLTEIEYHAALKAGERKDSFMLATRDATVYVKGRISHPDHKTVVLQLWHQVIPNTEAKAAWRPEMVFLD